MRFILGLGIIYIRSQVRYIFGELCPGSQTRRHFNLNFPKIREIYCACLLSPKVENYFFSTVSKVAVGKFCGYYRCVPMFSL